MCKQGCIDPPKAGRGHATPVQPVQRAKCWRLLNLEPRFEWYHVRARHNALIYRPYKETANVFLVTTSISPSVLAVWELHALSPPSAGRYALGVSHPTVEIKLQLQKMMEFKMKIMRSMSRKIS